MWAPWSSHLPRALVIPVLAALAALPVTAAEPAGSAPFDAVRVSDGWTAMLLRGALGRAARRLARPACHGLLGEFEDAQGRLLHAALDETGQTFAEALGELLFYDGTGVAPCHEGGGMAFTSPGSRVVLVCPARIRSQARRDLVQLDVVVIHEALHSLGLGEDPPSSRDISARIFSRCVANVGPSGD